MFAKKNIKARVAHFSSEDSQVSDYSMNSSFEAEQPEAQSSTAAKFNQLRETMNQLFLSNPELAEEIKFEKHYLSDEFEPEIPKTPTFNSPMHSKKTSTVPEGGFSGVVSDDFISTKSASPSKFWSAISSEMIKPQKNSKMPTLNQVNHILNIYKMKPEKPEGAEVKLSPKKPSSKKPALRVQSAKVTGDKKGEGKGKEAKTPTAGNNAEIIEEEEDGVKYYSFKKKMHLKLKQKWIERELENQARKRQLELEQQKQLQEREHERMMSTLAGLDEEIIRNQTTNQDEIEMFKKKRRIASQPKRNSNKAKGDIFERLTKDMNLKETPEEDEQLTKRVFLSQFAETLYKDMKEFGDPEAFKKIAQVRIQNFKKDFKERLAKAKLAPPEQLKFNKNKYRYLNMFVMDFEKTAQIPNKDSVFAIHEIQKESEEWKENPELDILAKFQKVRQGNIIGFWQEAKDLNNQ